MWRGLPRAPLPASTVSLRSWFAAVCGNSFSFRQLRLRTPLLAASSSARSKPRLGGRLELPTRVGVDGGEQSRQGMGRVDSAPKLDIMASLSPPVCVRVCVSVLRLCPRKTVRNVAGIQEKHRVKRRLPARSAPLRIHSPPPRRPRIFRDSEWTEKI